MNQFKMCAASIWYFIQAKVVTIHHSDNNIDDVTIKIESALSYDSIISSYKNDNPMDNGNIDIDEMHQEIKSNNGINLINYEHHINVALTIAKKCMNIKEEYKKESSSKLSLSILSDCFFIAIKWCSKKNCMKI